MKVKNYIFMQILNFLSYCAMVFVNALAIMLPLNSKTTGELSDAYPNLFVPAGITFSIWGVIYTMLLVFVIYQMSDIISPVKKREDVVSKIGMLFVLSSILNIGWIFAWHYENVLLSLLIMILLLSTLIAIYLKLEIGKKQVSGLETFALHIPFSIYLGWISVATIANATAFLVDYNWSGFGVSHAIWTVAVIAVGAALTIVMLCKRGDLSYAAVIIWAYFGIIIKRAAFKDDSSIAIMIACIAFILLILVFALIRKRCK